MKEDYVPFELAKKLKEKGFSMSSNLRYAVYNKENMVSERILYWNRFKHEPLAPTIPQVLKWLREEKEIYIDVASFPTYVTKNRVEFAVIVKHDSDGYDMKEIEMAQTFSEWNEAALVGIEHVVNNLI